MSTSASLTAAAGSASGVAPRPARVPGRASHGRRHLVSGRLLPGARTHHLGSGIPPERRRLWRAGHRRPHRRGGCHVVAAGQRLTAYSRRRRHRSHVRGHIRGIAVHRNPRCIAVLRLRRHRRVRVWRRVQCLPAPVCDVVAIKMQLAQRWIICVPVQTVGPGYAPFVVPDCWPDFTVLMPWAAHWTAGQGPVLPLWSIAALARRAAIRRRTMVSARGSRASWRW
jgi:hypothetical protein